MLDAKTVADELNQARLARIAAESAGSDLEELIWQVQYVPIGRGGRIAVGESVDLELSVLVKPEADPAPDADLPADLAA